MRLLHANIYIFVADSNLYPSRVILTQCTLNGATRYGLDGPGIESRLG
jgi:hypothetical protein